MKKPQTNKRVTPRAASFARIAKVLRIRASNFKRVATEQRKKGQFSTCDCYAFRAATLRDIAAELDNEARTLRAMR